MKANLAQTLLARCIFYYTYENMLGLDTFIEIYVSTGNMFQNFSAETVRGRQQAVALITAGFPRL